MANPTCKDCGARLHVRGKSRRVGEYLLACENGHKWQGTIIAGHIHLYRTNWKGHRGEGRKIATITISPDEFALMEKYGLKQQDVFLLGIDILRNKQ